MIEGGNLKEFKPPKKKLGVTNVKTLRKTCQISISKSDVSIGDIERFSGDKRHLGQYFH